MQTNALGILLGLSLFLQSGFTFAGKKEIHQVVVNPHNGEEGVEEWEEVTEFSTLGRFYLAVKSCEHLSLIQENPDAIHAFLNQEGFYQQEDQYHYSVIGYTTEGKFDPQRMAFSNQRFTQAVATEKKMKERAEALCRLKGKDRVIWERFDPIKSTRWMNRDLKVISLLVQPGAEVDAYRYTVQFLPGEFSAETQWFPKEARAVVSVPGLTESRQLKVPHLVFRELWCGKRLFQYSAPDPERN